MAEQPTAQWRNPPSRLAQKPETAIW